MNNLYFEIHNTQNNTHVRFAIENEDNMSMLEIYEHANEIIAEQQLIILSKNSFLRKIESCLQTPENVDDKFLKFFALKAICDNVERYILAGDVISLKAYGICRNLIIVAKLDKTQTLDDERLKSFVGCFAYRDELDGAREEILSLM